MRVFVAHREEILFRGVESKRTIPYHLISVPTFEHFTTSHDLHGLLVYEDRTAIILRRISGSSVASSFGPMRTSDPSITCEYTSKLSGP